LCREHGQQLTEIAASSDAMKGFGIFGVVKETGVVRGVLLCVVCSAWRGLVGTMR